MPQARPMMAPTSYIPGMQDPAFPEAASPASSQGVDDIMGDAPALLAGDDDMGMAPSATPPRRLHSVSAFSKKSPRTASGRPKVGPKSGPTGPSHLISGAPAIAPALPPAAASNSPRLHPPQTAGPSAASGPLPTLQQPSVPGLQEPADNPSSRRLPLSEPAQPVAPFSDDSQKVAVHAIPAMPPQAAAMFPAAEPAVARGPVANGHEAPVHSSGGARPLQWNAPGTAVAAGLPAWMDAQSIPDPSASGLQNGDVNADPATVGTHSEPPGPAAAEPVDASPTQAAPTEAPGSLQTELPHAELAGANAADGYGDRMFIAPELDYGISGDDSAAATPAEIRGLPLATENAIDDGMTDGHTLEESGAPLQQEGQLAGNSPTDIVPRLGTPPLPTGMPAAANSKPTADLPPPPPRSGAPPPPPPFQGLQPCSPHQPEIEELIQASCSTPTQCWESSGAVLMFLHA